MEPTSARDRHVSHGLAVVLDGLAVRHKAPEVGREAAVAPLDLQRAPATMRSGAFSC